MREDRLIETVDLRRAHHLAAPLLRLFGSELAGDLALGRSMTRALARDGWRSLRVVVRRERSGRPLSVVDLFGTLDERRSPA